MRDSKQEVFADRTEVIYLKWGKDFMYRPPSRCNDWQKVGKLTILRASMKRQVLTMLLLTLVISLKKFLLKLRKKFMRELKVAQAFREITINSGATQVLPIQY